MKKMKMGSNGISLIDVPQFFVNGFNIQFQSSPKKASAPYHEKAKAPKMNNKQHLNDRIFTPLTESPSVLLSNS